MRKQTVLSVSKKGALSNITDNHSVKTYKRACRKFVNWLETAKNIKYFEDIPEDKRVEYVQAYERFMENECLSAHTIHTYLAPICKTMGFSMAKINKPLRTAGRIKRSRDVTANAQGKREAEDERFKRLVDAQRALGLRRDELGKLTGRDLIKTSKNGLYVRVGRGKGGKFQLQKILPQHEDRIREIWKGIGPNDKVFTKGEMKNKIDLHSMRADLAKEAYKYYAEKIEKDPVFRITLIEDLSDRYFEYCNHCKTIEDMEKWRKQMLENDRPYVLRGENRQNAIDHGQPTELDRLAMTAVSVFHLSHWRLDVTSVNYLS